VVKSDSDKNEESIIIESSDDEVEAENKTEDEIEDEVENKIEDEVENKIKNEVEEHNIRISTSRRPQRNIQLPVRYRD